MDKTIKNGFTKLFFHDEMCSIECGKNGVKDLKRKKILYRNVHQVELKKATLLMKPILIFHTVNGVFYMPFNKKYTEDVILLKSVIEEVYDKYKSEENKVNNLQVKKESSIPSAAPISEKIKIVEPIKEEKTKIVLQTTMPDFAKNTVNTVPSKESVKNNVTNITMPNASEREYKNKTYRLAGINHYTDNIERLLIDNENYDLSKKQLVEEYDLADAYEDTYIRIYKYEPYDTTNVKLVKEDNNQYDPNAVAVYADEIMIGYIKKGTAKHIRNVLDNHRIKSISLEITGGDYKILSCEEIEDDNYNSRFVYSLEKVRGDDASYYGVLTIDEYI